MAKVSAPLECFFPLREERTRTVISYGLEIGNPLSTWHEVAINKRDFGTPSLEAVKRAIFADINARTSQRIIGGMVWKDKPVWLSRDNQANWQADYEQARELGESAFPMKTKLGEDGEGNPVYHTFNSFNSLNDFHKAYMQHRQQCLQDGWRQKDSIDWSQYAPQE